MNEQSTKSVTQEEQDALKMIRRYGFQVLSSILRAHPMTLTARQQIIREEIMETVNSNIQSFIQSDTFNESVAENIRQVMPMIVKDFITQKFQPHSPVWQPQSPASQWPMPNFHPSWSNQEPQYQNIWEAPKTALQPDISNPSTASWPQLHGMNGFIDHLYQVPAQTNQSESIEVKANKILAATNAMFKPSDSQDDIEVVNFGTPAEKMVFKGGIIFIDKQQMNVVYMLDAKLTFETKISKMYCTIDELDMPNIKSLVRLLLDNYPVCFVFDFTRIKNLQYLFNNIKPIEGLEHTLFSMCPTFVKLGEDLIIDRAFENRVCNFAANHMTKYMSENEPETK